MILFDGGSSIGLRRFRAAAVPIASLGVLGTFATAGLVALFAHWALGLGWITAGLLGAAIAPTDPAVMFSVLGDREIGGRTGTILEGESGANDPVGIALMLGLIELATHADATFWVVVRVFCEQMAIGLAIGIAGGLVEARLLRRVALPSAGLYTVRTLALAGIVYGVATVAHGSGFLAVFVAGLLVGDVEAPFKARDRGVPGRARRRSPRSSSSSRSGLTIDLGGLGADRWLEGLAIAAFVALVARPLVAGALLAPVAPAAGRAAVRHVGRAEGRGADPARRVRARGSTSRRAADLRDRVRRRARVGRRQGGRSRRSSLPASSRATPRANVLSRDRTLVRSTTRTSRVARRLADDADGLSRRGRATCGSARPRAGAAADWHIAMTTLGSPDD